MKELTILICMLSVAFSGIQAQQISECSQIVDLDTVHRVSDGHSSGLEEPALPLDQQAGEPPVAIAITGIDPVASSAV